MQQAALYRRERQIGYYGFVVYRRKSAGDIGGSQRRYIRRNQREAALKRKRGRERCLKLF